MKEDEYFDTEHQEVRKRDSSQIQKISPEKSANKSQIVAQPKDTVKDKILLANNCNFSQQQFLGSKGAEPLGNEEVFGIVSDMYAAMDEFANKSIQPIKAEHAVAFGKHLCKHGWKSYSENNWENEQDDTANTESLYQDFINANKP